MYNTSHTNACTHVLDNTQTFNMHTLIYNMKHIY